MVCHKLIGFDHFIVAVPLERRYGLFVIWHFDFLLILVLLVQPMYVFVRFRHLSGWRWVLFSLQIFRPSNWRRVAFFVKLNVTSVFNFKNCRPWLQRTLTPDNRVVSVGWKISSWTRLGSSGFGFSSFSSSVAAPSLVLNVDFNTCEWNELYYNYIRRLR